MTGPIPTQTTPLLSMPAQLMMEKGGGQERCLVRVGEMDAHEDYRQAGLLHFAVLNDSPELITYLAPFMKKCVVGVVVVSG